MPHTNAFSVVERGPWSREKFDATPTNGIVPGGIRKFIEIRARTMKLHAVIQDINMMWNDGFVLQVDDYVLTPRMANLAWPVMPLPE